jgi:hypothetical protein
MRIFLGSSTESLAELKRLGTLVESAGHTALYWNGPELFLPGENTFLRLVEISQQVDAALFLFAEDDRVWYRSDALAQPRDNVLIEYGLFAGALGQERVAIFRYGSPKTASDLAGVIATDLPARRGASVRLKLQAWLRKLESPDASRTGADISGEWSSYDSVEPTALPAGSARITQRGASVAMTLHRTRSRDGNVTDRRFRYHGTLSAGQLTLLFEDERARGFITGSIVLRLSSTLRLLTGKTVYFNHDLNAVSAYDFQLRRDD